jgi:hypothetical protein
MSEAITTIDQLAAQLEAADTPQEDDENAQPEAEAQSDDQQEAGEPQEDQEQPVEGEGDQPATESLDDKVVAWETASGDKYEVPVAELKNGYMRTEDYTRSKQNLSVEREQAAKQIQEQFQTVEAYAQDFGALYALNNQVAALEQSIQTLDKNSDPIGYFDAVTQYQMLKDQRNSVASKLQQVNQQRGAQMQEYLAQAKHKMAQELQSAIPGFGKELLTKLDSTAGEYGYTSQDLQMVTDPRFVKVLHDAMKFRDLQAKKPETVNKVKAAPVKPTKQASTAVDSGIQKQVKQFSQKKDLKSFAALLQHTL